MWCKAINTKLIGVAAIAHQSLEEFPKCYDRQCDNPIFFLRVNSFIKIERLR